MSHSRCFFWATLRHWEISSAQSIGPKKSGWKVRICNHKKPQPTDSCQPAGKPVSPPSKITWNPPKPQQNEFVLRWFCRKASQINTSQVANTHRQPESGKFTMNHCCLFDLPPQKWVIDPCFIHYGILIVGECPRRIKSTIFRVVSYAAYAYYKVLPSTVQGEA